MKTISGLEEMQKKSAEFSSSGKKIGFVPTMGALHEGHLSLVRRCKKENEVAVVSIFVNPIQFGPREDYTRYPRNPRDAEVLQSENVDIFFAPEAREMFPQGFQTRVEVEQLSKHLCGPFRPGHFKGVATVVLKLFNLVNPRRAYFGEKDYQQLQVVRQMAQDLNLPVEIVPCPTVREPDGLAMSSRNTYLSKEEREAARILYASLLAGKEAIVKGERNSQSVRQLMENKIKEEPLVSIEYIEIADPVSLSPIKEINGKVLLALAARVGKTRLIDNLLVEKALPLGAGG